MSRYVYRFGKVYFLNAIKSRRASWTSTYEHEMLESLAWNVCLFLGIIESRLRLTFRDEDCLANANCKRSGVIAICIIDSSAEILAGFRIEIISLKLSTKVRL